MFFFEGYTLTSVLGFIAFLVALVAINEITRRNKIAGLVVFGLLPIVLCILIFTNVLGSPTGKSWFSWVKLFSALAGVYGFMAIRYTKIGKTKFALYFPVAILALNILEAVIRELEVFNTFKEMGLSSDGSYLLAGPWNILNAIAGIICIVTLTGFVGIRVSKKASKDMIWPDMLSLYIIGYSLWNFTYVYNCISSRSMYAGFGLLLAAALGEYLFRRGAWLQHRAQTLSFYVMFSLAFDFMTYDAFTITASKSEAAWMTMGIISFTFNILFLGYAIYKVVKTKKNPYTKELFADSKEYQIVLANNDLV